MKKILFVALGLSFACNSSQKTISQQIEPVNTSVDPMVYAQSITEAELKEHLYTYASDEFEGRDTGEPGQKLAVEYLKAEYVELGIPAAQSDGNYFQNVPLVISKLPKGSVSINGKEYQNGEGLLTFTTATGSFDNIVYVSYGIEEENYSDYTGIDVKGKIVLIKAGEPMNADGTYKISGSNEASVWSNMSESIGKRMELASSKGAIGVMYFDEGNYGRFKNRFNFMQSKDSGSMGLKDEVQNDFYSFFIDADVANAILPNIKSENTSKNVSTKLVLNIESDSKDVESENVVAVIKGSEKPDEYVIISAHLDHVGVNKEGEIFNGADDDGSGTVGLLEIAEAFKKAADDGNGPKRSIVFLHVTGEEKGLLGSKYYADHDPIFPLSQTVADLNIDMIGRIDPNRTGDRNYIYLIGSDKLSTELHELSEEVNKKYMNIELDYTYNDENDPNRFYYRSDHYNFAKNNIPIIFYFNGTHADYHQPGDTPDKINYDLLENRTRLVFLTAWEIANREARLKVDKATK
ncbi:M28 family peptidase [Arenibacter troitsensis]|uniref:Zn-dependent amino-or carboxypeptidase, M28 family n=1 Tax=Arenibacter troitsensis TaxID=188872 RepID=A0A1X7JE79_9FLAO|nr:M28 family peptidase [Arenibacter troitsensis]SMG25759.1 Zn-dependent amino-or carboxypeptidase, M28 family [Arenibacter troitsensis]